LREGIEVLFLQRDLFLISWLYLFAMHNLRTGNDVGVIYSGKRISLL